MAKLTIEKAREIVFKEFYNPEVDEGLVVRAGGFIEGHESREPEIEKKDQRIKELIEVGDMLFTAATNAKRLTMGPSYETWDTIMIDLLDAIRMWKVKKGLK
jgi:hypothetical protein